MLTFFSTIYKICCLQKGPQDLVYSRQGCLGLLLANVLLLVLVSQLAHRSLPADMLLIEVASYAILFVFLLSALWLRGFVRRLIQSLSAFFAVELIYNGLITLLVVLFVGDKTPLVVAYVATLCYLWLLLIYAHIFRHALSITMPAAILLTVAFEMLRVMIVMSAFMTDVMT